MLRVLGMVVLVGLVAAGCANTPVTPPPPDPAAVDGGFVTAMVPHHEQALELSAMVPARSASPAVAALALRIDRDQVEEIGQLQGLARARGWPAGAPMAMGGMADAATLDRLRALQGPAFDRLWLDTMIRHHEGALAMARDYLATGSDDTLRRFCQVLITGQSAEIDMMRAAGASP